MGPLLPIALVREGGEKSIELSYGLKRELLSEVCYALWGVGCADMSVQSECLVPATPKWTDLTPGGKPAFHAERLALFQKIKERNDAERAKLPNDPIKITLPDGTVKQGIKVLRPLVKYRIPSLLILSAGH